MIKDEKIKINISYRNITHYIKLGYNPILNEMLEIKAIDLPTVSHQIIVAICEICGVQRDLKYHKYVENKKRHGFYGCKSCSRQKAALTSLEKWGCESYSLTEEYKKRVEKTNIEKYGYKTNLLNPEYQKLIKSKIKDLYGTENFWEIRERKDKKRFKMNDKIESLRSYDEIIYSEDKYDNSLLNENYYRYRTECRRLTEKNIKKLLEDWSGLDYYDGDNISENFNLEHNDSSYPTIDHKTAIYYGYINNIDPKEIAKISNLCITKRGINSLKRDMCESDFLDFLKSK